MRNLFIIILFGAHALVSLADAKKWNTNKDSIVVDAYSEDEDEGELLFDALEQPDNTECMTLDQEPGVCVTLRRCHPILFGDNGEVRNPSLAHEYSQNVDACGSLNALEDEPVNVQPEFPKPIPSKSSLAERILCCAKDKIQYVQRSSVDTSDEEMAMYPTTLSPLSDLPAETKAEQTTLAAEELIVLDITVSDSSPHSAIEVETTIAPEVPEVLANEVVGIVTEPHTTSTTSFPSTAASEPSTQAPVAPEISPEVSTSAPKQPEITPEPESQQNDNANACPEISAYNTWPTFENYPYLASIQTRANTGPLCSGSLIDSRHVLTAAHCLHRFNSKDVARMQVRIGFSKNPGNDTYNHFYLERKASKIIFHKRFHEQSKMDNNIALVQLNSPVQFDLHVTPIKIFNGAGGFDQGSCAAVEAGWIKYGNRKVTGISEGVIQYVEAPQNDFVLREAINKIYTNSDCQSKLYTQINDDMLCAKTDSSEAHGVSTDRFRGNDGGPLVIRVGDRIQQVGIKSWAYEGHQYPTVYTRVDKYLPWIRENLQL